MPDIFDSGGLILLSAEIDGDIPLSLGIDGDASVEFDDMAAIVPGSYNRLADKPTITEPDYHTVTIQGDLTFGELGMRPMDAVDVLQSLA